MPQGRDHWLVYKLAYQVAKADWRVAATLQSYRRQANDSCLHSNALPVFPRTSMYLRL